MSDDDDTPPAAAAVVPEAGKGWSEQDRRTLIITAGGTLAANLVTVILVGAALALVHLSKTRGSRLLIPTLVAVVAGPVGIVIGTFLRRWAGPFEVWGDNSWWGYGWLMIVLGWLLELVAVMILIGLAAGVK